MNGFKVYDKSHSAEGRVIYENGTGIAEADTVIYIGAHETEHCRRFEVSTKNIFYRHAFMKLMLDIQNVQIRFLVFIKVIFITAYLGNLKLRI